jgi:hypothetical protein
MQALKKVVGFWAQGQVASHRVGIDLSPSVMALVAGGSPKPGWGVQPTADSTTTLDASPKPGW